MAADDRPHHPPAMPVAGATDSHLLTDRPVGPSGTAPPAVPLFAPPDLEDDEWGPQTAPEPPQDPWHRIQRAGLISTHLEHEYQRRQVQHRNSCLLFEGRVDPREDDRPPLPPPPVRGIDRIWVLAVERQLTEINYLWDLARIPGTAFAAEYADRRSRLDAAGRAAAVVVAGVGTADDRRAISELLFEVEGRVNRAAGKVLTIPAEKPDEARVWFACATGRSITLPLWLDGPQVARELHDAAKRSTGPVSRPALFVTSTELAEELIRRGVPYDPTTLAARVRTRLSRARKRTELARRDVLPDPGSPPNRPVYLYRRTVALELLSAHFGVH